MESWGFCGECDRWFHSSRDKAAWQRTCPVCGAQPEVFADRPPEGRPPASSRRDQAPRGPAPTDTDGASRPRAGSDGRAATALKGDVRIQGLCPKCRDWFDCDDWFDQSLPRPCCPDCGLGPTRVQYQPARGHIVDIQLAPSDLWIG